MRVIALVTAFLIMAPSFGAMAQERGPDSEQPQTLSSIKRTYPGGRDDSDLTVQPKKRITKKETDASGVEPDEGDYDQGDTASGFGE